MKIFEGLLQIKQELASGFPSQQWFLHSVISLPLVNFPSSVVLALTNIYINTKLTLCLYLQGRNWLATWLGQW